MGERWNLQDVWNIAVIPARPSQSDMNFIEGHVKTLEGRSAKALVLGCTPEFRDILMKYEIDTTCVDYNLPSFHGFRKAMKYEDRSRLVEADWRKMELNEKYDLVLGDLSFTMLNNMDDWGSVAGNIDGALKRNGKILHRTWLRIPGAYASFDDIMKEHKTRQGMHPFTSLAYPLFQHFVKEDGAFDWMEVTNNFLKEKYERGVLTKDEFRYFEVFCGNFNTVMQFPTKQKADELFSRYFRIEQVKYCDEWFRDFCPIYVLGKKGGLPGD